MSNSLSDDDSLYETDVDSIPTIGSEQGSLGDIKINFSVVASIARLSALEVDGVCEVGGSGDSITQLFTKKEADRGVVVNVDEKDNYQIEVRVSLRFGVNLGKVAVMIQQNVRQQVMKMTSKGVSRVDVKIDGIKMQETRSKPEDTILDEPWHGTHSD